MISCPFDPGGLDGLGIQVKLFRDLGLQTIYKRRTLNLFTQNKMSRYIGVIPLPFDVLVIIDEILKKDIKQRGLKLERSCSPDYPVCPHPKNLFFTIIGVGVFYYTGKRDEICSIMLPACYNLDRYKG